MTNIWLVEDEATIADTLIYKLQAENYEVKWFERGQILIDKLSKEEFNHPDLIILDIGLPDMTGFDLAKIIVSKWRVPIIFLTARTEEVDRIVGFEIGADDYIAKPFSPREVIARVKAVLRRTSVTTTESNTYQQGPFILEDDSKFIYYYSQPLMLTRYEYLLLKTLICAPNRVYSRAQLMELVWQDNLETMERTVDTHIKTIRQKLVAINAAQQPIQTHRGLGYSLTIS